MAEPKKNKGSEFEKATQTLFKAVFTELGFHVIDVRKQWSGTQNGFDVRVTFLDADESERVLFFECKNYDSDLDWSSIVEKVLELESSNYHVDGFVALSPKKELSNIKDHVAAGLQGKFKFPIRYFTPESGIKELFSIDREIYKTIYGEYPNFPQSRSEILDQFRLYIRSILKEKQALKYANIIEIKASDEVPNEDGNYITNLDKKLSAVLAEDDLDREEYHRYRCEYKVFLEGLSDVNNDLRNKILKWQDNLRIKAKRLSKKFIESNDYTPTKFFNDFFEIADIELRTFYANHRLDGDNERLLHGVVFELAAECPLDWRPRNGV